MRERERDSNAAVLSVTRDVGMCETVCDSNVGEGVVSESVCVRE